MLASQGDASARHAVQAGRSSRDALRRLQAEHCMLEAGEDPMYVARRLVRFASEDIGNADPRALQLAVSVKDAVHFLGMPEGNTALASLRAYVSLPPEAIKSEADAWLRIGQRRCFFAAASMAS